MRPVRFSFQQRRTTVEYPFAIGKNV
jgi:hypothetical protein